MLAVLPLAAFGYQPGLQPSINDKGLCKLDTSGCKLSCDGDVFDLSKFGGLLAEGTTFYHKQDSEQHDYYFGPCGVITGVTCTGTSAQSPVAVQTWGDPAPPPPDFPSDSCAGLGDLSSAICQSNVSSVACLFAGGDDGRAVSFQYQCAKTFTPPTASQDGEGTYLISFAGPSVCSGGGSAGGTSWGTLTLILLPVAVGLYLSGGYYYNYKYKELRGMDAIPQLEYWKEVPGLVKDGCLFSYKQTLLFINWLREKYQGGAPADPALKQALADDTDEAGASTSYQADKA